MPKFPAQRFERALLLLDAYLTPGQNDLIPNDFHIEHILPQSWKKTYYDVWKTKDEAKQYIEMLGNKVVLEFKVNIAAGDKYFTEKCKIYKNGGTKKVSAGSKIKVVLNLADQNKKQDDWGKYDIEKRHRKFAAKIIDFFNEQIC